MMGLRLRAVFSVLACAIVCALLEPTSAQDDSFYTREYSQEILRKLESEIFAKTSPMQPLDYLMLYVIELKQGMAILNDTVSDIGRKYHDMWKKEAKRMNRANNKGECFCDDSDSDKDKQLQARVDAIQGDVQRVLEELRNIRSSPAGVCGPQEPRMEVDPYEQENNVQRPDRAAEARRAQEESNAREAVKAFKANNWKNVKKSLANVLKKTSPAYQQLQAIPPQDKTPLNTMAQKGYTELLGELLDRGLPADTLADETFRYDMLSAAAISGNMAVAQQLLEHGAPTGSTNNRGVTPLMFAASKNHLDVVKELVRRGADVNRKNIDGSTALDLARKRGNQEVVDFLSSIAPDSPGR